MTAIRNGKDCVLCAVIDPADNGTRAAQLHSVPRFTSLGAMFEELSPDAVIIATPNATHVQLAMQCMARGIPSLVEKPIADSVDEAYRLAGASEKLGVPILVGHHRRHNPLIKRARELITSGRIGDVVALSSSWLVKKPDEYFDVSWRREPGGGPILINLIHDIDTLRHLIGEIVSVQGVVTNRWRGSEVEDTAAIIAVFDSGAIGTITLSDVTPAPWSWELTAGESTSYSFPKVKADCYLIAGSKGALGVPSLKLWCHSGVQSWQSPMQEESIAVESVDPIVLQLAHFCRVVRGHEIPLVSARDAARSLEVTLSVEKAAKLERSIALPVLPNGGAALGAVQS